MDEDARFPNRKRKNWDEPSLGDKLPDAELPEFNSESREAGPLPTSGYHILGSASENPGDQAAEGNLYDPLSAIPDAAEEDLIDVSAAAEEQKPAAEPSIPRPRFHGFRIERIRNLAKNPTAVYVAAGVCMGVMLGVVVAISSYLMAGPTGRYDLGPASSSATGLTGNLKIQWDKKLEYRLTIKPGDPDQQAGFALAVANSPRPLSIEIHLQDSGGFVLCSKQIVLKYDAGNGAAPAGSAALPLAGKTDAGKDIFQNQIGPDGQIAAINSQGDLSCSAEAYEKAANWSFSTNYPSLAEQDEWLKRQQEMEANAERLSAEKPAARAKRMAPKAAARLLPFSIEGDDAIVDFDTSRGVIQTRGRKTFLVDKATAAGADPSWQDYPVSIHYRCDQSSSCTLMHSGAGSLRASLGR
jgi:hypothetical protein